MTDADAQKRAAAARALDFIESGMKVGLGTGSTAEHFVELLAERLRNGSLRDIVGTPTSRRTEEKSRALGIPLADLNELQFIDVVVDGADEADVDLNLIKGGGGALLREKLVALAAKQMIVIADESKFVRQLGRFPLPVEVIAFAHRTTELRLRAACQVLGYSKFRVELRGAGGGQEFRTDSGNVIYDLHLNEFRELDELEGLLDMTPGVVDHGLFTKMASVLILAGRNGVRVIERSDDDEA